MQSKSEKMFLVFQVVAFEVVVVIYPYYYDNSRRRQSTC